MKRLCDEDCSRLERVQRGDQQAIALLYHRYSTHQAMGDLVRLSNLVRRLLSFPDQLSR